jgi:hypothetical protein
MEKLKKYKTQIFNFITVFLIVTFAIYPGLTTANTILNILAGISALLLLVWGGIALYDYARSSVGYPSPVDETITQPGETELDYVSKPKPKRKPKSVVKIDFTDAKGMNEIAGVVNPIAEGRVKVSVETLKAKRKPKITN